ncbi:hypothetical protein [Halocatena marina]|uniref:hypothetical protein n=1 Tax=Halocatena marina TaxID=2934937 RepID=UPI00200BC12E|nr:hypothetical protein [Halocatena marina]
MRQKYLVFFFPFPFLSLSPFKRFIFIYCETGYDRKLALMLNGRSRTTGAFE